MNNWTDELLDLMVEKMVERKEREMQAIGQMRTGTTMKTNTRTVPDSVLLSEMGIKVEKK